nr:hypothetical protein Iba_chr14aCG16880 [Ipomoea batatas]
MLASEGTGNFDKKGSTSSSPIDLRVVFLLFSPFLRFDESEELTTGGPWNIEITPSKFMALFLAVNKSSLHPEISSYGEGRFFLIYSSGSSSHSAMSYIQNFRAGKIAEFNKEEKWGETNLHPCLQNQLQD